MNANVSPLNLITRARPDDRVDPAEGDDLGFSPRLGFRYDRDEATLWSEWSQPGIPCFGLDLLLEFARASRVIESSFGRGADRPLEHVVLASKRRDVFSVGGDLGFFVRAIASGDAVALDQYARAATAVVHRNYVAHNVRGATTIALLEGDALGGGFECALSCDVVVAERQAKAGFPEVLFDMFPGMGGMSFVSRRANRAVANEVLRSGRMYSALELKDLGLVDHVVAPGEGRAAVASIVRERRRHPTAHASMNLVERMIRPVTEQELDDVARVWVDCALALPERGLAWMRRLHERQLQIFGAATKDAPATSSLAAAA